MTERVFVKQGDLLPVVDATLSDASGPVDLASASGVQFIMARSGETPVVDQAATVMQVGDGSDGSLGMVRYAWAAGDTDESGHYLAEFQVTFAGKALSFPNDGYLEVVVTPELG